MPLLDLPVEALFRYEGRNPRPADFDEFWDAALREMESVDPAPQLVPHPISAPFAECFDLTFIGVGGARVYAKYLRPKQIEAVGAAILQFHGYSGNSGDWMDKLPYVARGQAVASLDCRGQGGRSQNPVSVTGNTQSGHIIRGLDDALNGSPEKLYFRQVFLDCAQLARVLASFPEIDGARLGAMGGSQGGALTLACAALAPIKRAAATYPFLCDYQRVWEMDLAQNAYSELKTYFRQFDPCHERASEIWTALGYIDVQHLAPRIGAQVLMGVGLSDSVCPPSTQFAAFNRIQAPKEAIFYPDFGHEHLPGFSDKTFDFMAEL